MALEAIQKVTQAEESSRQRLESISAENRQKILVAQRAAQRVLEEGRLEAEGEVRQMMAEVEREAARKNQELLDQAARENEMMKQAARQRLDQAAELIVEKVVNG